MSQVVQAKCPHCQNVLRIPAEWVSKSMRCKHCKSTFQAKANSSTSANVPIAAPSATAKSAPAVKPVAKAAPVAAVAVAQPAAAAPPPPASGSPFGFDVEEPAAPSSSTPRRRGRGKGLPLLVAMFFFLFLLGGSGAGFMVYNAFQNAPPQREGKLIAKGDGAKPDVTPTKSKDVPENPTDGANEKKNENRSDDKSKEDAPLLGDGPIPIIDRPKKKTPPPTKKEAPKDLASKDGKKPAPPAFGNDPFPRRALLISVNNYLMFNTVHYGSVQNGPQAGYPGSSTGELRNRFTRPPMNFPATQVIELSDAVPPESKVAKAHPTQKSVIEITIKDFVETSREQDRIIIFYAGHAAFHEDKAYLVPIDGNMTNPDSLIPLQWVYDQLTSCKAQQKILILDVFRFSPGRGLEAPSPGEGEEGTMWEGFDKALLSPPPGVQVWSSCIKDQSSVELDAGSAFMQALCNSLQGTAAMTGISTPTQPIPIEDRVKDVNERLKMLLTPEKRTQVSRLTGKQSDKVVEFNKDEPLPLAMKLKPPTAAGAEAAGYAQVNSILDFFKRLSPVRESRAGDRNLLDARNLPAFSAKKLDAYKTDGYTSLTDLEKKYKANQETFAKDFPLRAAVLDAMEALEESGKIAMFEVQRSPVTPQRKNDIKKEQDLLGISTFKLEKARADLLEAGEKREMETSKRWQANFDYAQARLQSRLVYLIEYNYVLGRVRADDLPELAPGQSGWRIGTGTKVNVTEKKAKDIAKDTKKLWDRITKEYPDTPWAMLAQREKQITLGLKWRPKSD